VWLPAQQCDAAHESLASSSVHVALTAWRGGEASVWSPSRHTLRSAVVSAAALAHSTTALLPACAGPDKKMLSREEEPEE
jgi:hypothetical protein